MMKRYGVAAFGLVVGSLVAGACSSDYVPAAADAGGDAGSDVYVPPGCNTPDEPSKNTANCLVDAYGLFLKPTGNDVTGTGTKDNPLRTLGAAAAKLKGKAGRIVTCAGSYEGAGTEITSAISIYGGFSCADWTYGPSNETVFTTDTQKPDVVLTLRSVTGANVQDATIRARPGAVGGGSSIAVFVASSQGVKFLRAKLEADIGGDAQNGATQNLTLPDGTALQGNNADPKGAGTADDLGGPEKSVSCPGAKMTTGGKGGEPGFPGANAKPAPPIGGTGGTQADCGGGVRNGADGATGLNGAAPAGVGALASVGWKAAGGNPGLVGEPGGGGGGGYGAAGAGGGGGAGGCGGGPGTGGTAGGSSIALASLDSDVTLTDTGLTSKAAKKGGDGAAGQATRDEDIGPGGGRTGLACLGGNGGKGGSGGAGSGGAGGISVGAVYTKRKPTTERTQVTFGAAGAAGGGQGNPGVAGVAQELLEVPES